MRCPEVGRAYNRAVLVFHPKVTHFDRRRRPDACANGCLYYRNRLHQVNSRGKVSCVTERFHGPSADDYLEELRADAKLAEMEFLEEAAAWGESDGPPILQRHLENRYRAVVGVNPEHRQELQSAMEQVKAGGGMPVADVIDLINHAKGRDHHAKGSV